jgi:hypothetical protein
VSVTPSHADTEGPRFGPRCRVAVEEVSERSERGRASDEGARTRLAKEKPLRNEKKESNSRPAGQNKGLTQWNDEWTGPRGKTKAVMQ